MQDQIALPPSPRSASEAREWVKQLGMPLRFERAEAAQLLVSELVGRAVNHGALPGSNAINLTLQAEDGVVRVEVTDLGSPPPSIDGDPADGIEWGYFLVDKLADRWGIEDGEPRRLWFEIDVYQVGPAVVVA